MDGIHHDSNGSVVLAGSLLVLLKNLRPNRFPPNRMVAAESLYKNGPRPVFLPALKR